MKFIDNSEDYDGAKIYEYEMIFLDLNETQYDFLISHFDDYSWSSGLAINEGFVESNGNRTVFRFTSIKKFDFKNSEEMADDDLELNLITRLIGKEQFFSNMFFEGIGLEEKSITFISGDEKYKVTISKYSDMEKI
jgi:hypothetical protein